MEVEPNRRSWVVPFLVVYCINSTVQSGDREVKRQKSAAISLDSQSEAGYDENRKTPKEVLSKQAQDL
jgi:hypothetical protein